MPIEQIPFFDDWKSWGHGVLGVWYSTNKSPFIPLGFLVYQMLEAEPLDTKLGDFAEFTTGFLLAEGIRQHGRHS